MSLIKCAFVSMWDDGSQIVTDCIYDNETGSVSAEMSDADPDASLEREYITLEGEEIDVCTTCHEFIMKTNECSNIECESNHA